MKTVQDIAFYMNLYERYHPHVTKDELKQLTLGMLSELPDNEKSKFIEEYSEYVNRKSIPEDYVNLYHTTNEAP